MRRASEDERAPDAGPPARSRGIPHWLRAGLFLLIVYAFAAPKLIDHWHERQQQSQTRSAERDTASEPLALPNQPRPPGLVMRTAIVNGQIQMRPVPGAETILDAGTEIELTADQVKRIEDITTTARTRTDELGRNRAEVESHLRDAERANSVDASEMMSWVEEIARMDEERIAVQQKSYEDALHVLHPPQKDRMTEILDGG